MENLITAKCNLGIAHFFNSEVKEAVGYIEEALGHFNSEWGVDKSSNRSVF